MIIVNLFTTWQHVFFISMLINLEQTIAVKAIDMRGIRDSAAR